MAKTSTLKVQANNSYSNRRRKEVQLPKMSYHKMIFKELSNEQKEDSRVFTSIRKLIDLISSKYKVTRHRNQRKFFLIRGINVLESKNYFQRKRNSLRLREKFLKGKNKKISPIQKSKKIKIVKLKTTNNKIAKVFPKTKSLLYPMLNVNNLSTFICNPLKFSSPATLSSQETNYTKSWPATWHYFDNNIFNSKIRSADGWYDYDDDASDIVEDEWQRYIVNRGMNDVRSVKSGEWEYMVDFANWSQTNTLHQNHKVRSVRRLDENGKVSTNPYQ